MHWTMLKTIRLEICTPTDASISFQHSQRLEHCYSELWIVKEPQDKLLTDTAGLNIC